MRTLIGVDDPLTVRERRLLRLRHTFSGASLTPSDLGPSFTTVSGTPSVSGGVLSKADATNVELRANGLAANIVYQAKLNFGNSAATNRRMLLRARQNADGSNRFQLTLNRASNQIVLARVDASTPTTIASVSYTVAGSTDYWLRWVMNGSRHEVLISTGGATFASQFTATDAAYASQTAIGLFLIDDAVTPTCTVDDLLVWMAP